MTTSMSSPKKVKTPADPDPTPIASATSADARSAGREEQKRISKLNGRMKTILAAQNESPVQKKNILGG